jgi:hypothetical protein
VVNELDALLERHSPAVRGALLPDAASIVEGTGKRIRHVKCRTLEDISRPALRTLLEEQASRRRTG